MEDNTCRLSWPNCLPAFARATSHLGHCHEHERVLLYTLMCLHEAGVREAPFLALHSPLIELLPSRYAGDAFTGDNAAPQEAPAAEGEAPQEGNEGGYTGGEGAPEGEAGEPAIGGGEGGEGGEAGEGAPQEGADGAAVPYNTVSAIKQYGNACILGP